MHFLRARVPQVRALVLGANLGERELNLTSVILSEGERPSRRTPAPLAPPPLFTLPQLHSHSLSPERSEGSMHFLRALCGYFFSVTISEKSAIVENSFNSACRSARRLARTFSSSTITITLSKNVSTAGRMVAISASAPA